MPRNINNEKYILDEKPIGKGGLSKLFKARSDSDSKFVVAIKKISKRMISKDEVSLIKNDVDQLTKLDHPNVAKYYCYYEDKEFLYVVSEFIFGESLGHHIDLYKNDSTEYEISQVMSQLFQAVHYLHKHKIIHRNIKPENIMIDSFGKVTLVDFGICLLTKTGWNIDKRKDVSQFLSPESFHGIITEKLDIWALGNMMYLLLAGKLPLTGDSVMSVFKKATKRDLGFKNSTWKDISIEAKTLIKNMLIGDHTKRIASDFLINSEWLRVAQELDTKGQFECVDEVTLEGLRYNRFKSKLQKLLIHLMVNMLLDDLDFADLHRKFHIIDKDNDGEISFNELKKSLCSVYEDFVTDDEVQDIIEKLDFTGSGTINFNEFLTATIDKKLFRDPKNIRELFKTMDILCEGKVHWKYIFRELQAVDTYLTSDEVYELIKTSSLYNAEYISIGEFERLIKKY